MLLISAAQRAVATTIAREVAARLASVTDRDGAAAATRRPGTRSDHAGQAQLYAALHDREPRAGWDATGHRLLENAVTKAGSAGLFSGGLAGLGVAAVLLRGRTGRYRGLLEKLDAAVVPIADHDLINGTAGAGVYALLRGRPPAIVAVTAALAEAAAGDPPFFVPPHRVPPAWSLPEGYVDCGLAHGAAGPVALLALLTEQGKQADLSAEHAERPEVRTRALTRAADWLLDAAETDEWGIAWPAGLAGDDRMPSPRRASWCYGVPGIARALWLAGRALDEPHHQSVARDAMTALLDASDAWGLDSSPNLCHGIAGLLLVTAAFAADDARFAPAAEDLLDRLVDAFDPSLPLGFDVTGPGLLTGAAGIALTLLTVTGDSPADDPALRPFLVG
ncbi:hypothetical protein GCM10027176_09750 [Actinoallomurus bryophytorum]